METPTIVLVHGFWAGPAHWGKVILELSGQGYTKIKPVDLALTSLAEDAERTRRVLRQIDGPVLLVGHSYGGAVITEAGDEPNVVGLAYVAAFAPNAGESLGGISEKHPAEAMLAGNIVPDSDGFLWIRREKYQESLGQDLNDDDALVMAVTQKAPLASIFGNEVSTAAWGQKPSWYQLSTDDRMIHPDAQLEMADRLKPRKLVEIQAGHASLVSHPREIANLIADAIADVTSIELSGEVMVP